MRNDGPVLTASSSGLGRPHTREPRLPRWAKIEKARYAVMKPYRDPNKTGQRFEREGRARGSTSTSPGRSENDAHSRACVYWLISPQPSPTSLTRSTTPAMPDGRDGLAQPARPVSNSEHQWRPTGLVQKEGDAKARIGRLPVVSDFSRLFLLGALVRPMTLPPSPASPPLPASSPPPQPRGCIFSKYHELSIRSNAPSTGSRPATRSNGAARRTVKRSSQPGTTSDREHALFCFRLCRPVV